MRLWTLIPAVTIFAFAAGCGEQTPEPRVASTPPAGAGSTNNEALPPAPKATQADEKPDPGDANDHSTPRHDARKRKNGD